MDNHRGRDHRSSSSGDSSHGHGSSRRGVNKSEWFDISPLSIGDIIPRSGGLSLEDFGSLPFDADGNRLSRASSSSFCRSDNTSVCESVCSDQAVIYDPAVEEEVRNPSSFHSYANTTVSSQEKTILETPRSDEEDDSFDPDAAMRAPPTDNMTCQSHHHFHRISQYASLPQYMPEEEDKPIDTPRLEEEDDSFDPDAAMRAPPTGTMTYQPHRSFHRISKHASLPEYILGQEGKPIDMIEESSRMSAQLAVASLLRQFDAAFIRRSDGKWTYAILAEKIMGKEDPGEDGRRGLGSSKLRFVVDVNGSTKNFLVKKWGVCVRLVRDPMEANALLLSNSGNCGKVDRFDRKTKSRVGSEVQPSFGKRQGKL